jgi:hypothetical protein
VLFSRCPKTPSKLNNLTSLVLDFFLNLKLSLKIPDRSL